MTATAVVITLKILRDLHLQDTRMARVVVASCMFDDLLTLVMFSVVLGFVCGESLTAIGLKGCAITLARLPCP
jgi:Kef-type K+ transport system membrane component KefB